MSQQVVARYFDMWNSGDVAAAPEILSPRWVDHAHPEVASPWDVQQAVERVRAAQPDLRFRVDAILGDGDLVAAIGTVERGRAGAAPGSRLVWLVRLEGGRMAEMWTYREEPAAGR